MAWHLMDSGKRILVVDRDEENTSSKVSAGLVTPLTGSRFAIDPGLEEHLNYSRQFYWNLEERSGLSLFHHSRIVRLFSSQEESVRWTERLQTDGSRYAPFHAPLSIDSGLINAPYGGFEMREGGWLDVPRFLSLTRQTLLERASYAISALDAHEVENLSTGIRWKNVDADWIVFCEGWRGGANPFFDWVPLIPAPGDILDIEVPALASETRILNKEGWMIPLGDGRFRAGSTYRHGTGEAASESAGREEVLAKVSSLTSCPVTFLSQRSAVRPTIKRSQIFIGCHARYPRIAYLNGMGSKGVLNGPWYARCLTHHLLNHEPLPPEADLAMLLP